MPSSALTVANTIQTIRASDKQENSSVYFAKIDVDELPELSQELGIRAMPTFIAFKNGEKLDTLVGANRGRLEALIVKSKA